ncbi:hypothetical protein ACHHYP_15562 [Achlya hypogyna]|uniref:Uncharacterized protein n=1 Tax=Achlya hypogyna TaxID=1202772 RepID=A0A1V9YAL6_ACHHY|nr:hypothetical protein ACHHYP_15562 [Achlya hypogyna]
MERLTPRATSATDFETMQSPRHRSYSLPTMRSPRPRLLAPVLALARKSLGWSTKVSDTVPLALFRAEEEETKEDDPLAGLRDQREVDARSLQRVEAVEAEARTTLEKCLATRASNAHQRDLIARRLELYREMLARCTPTATASWPTVVEMVTHELPRCLDEVGTNFVRHDNKVRSIQQQLVSLEFKRKNLEERIASQDARLALSSHAVQTA